MSTFFSRERFGQPQGIAALLLLMFLAQCVWLVSRDLRQPRFDPDAMFRIETGLSLWGMHQSAAVNGSNEPGIGDHTDLTFDRHHSRLYYLIAAAPFLAWPGGTLPDSFSYWGWLARAPYVFFGIMLGASLWYVARRLYGNAGGYIALVLYCFAPGMIRSSSLWFREPEIGAAWGTFGAVFTAIAVAHTLYAPREVVLWNWRRIILLGISLALAVGSQFSLIVLLPMVLAILLYLAPTRRGAALVIWLAGAVLSFAILLAGYFFHWSNFVQDLRHAAFFPITGQVLRIPGAYVQTLAELRENCPALVLAFPACLIVYAVWRHCRYFGNTAPLLVGLIFLALGFFMPHYPGLGFRMIAVPFIFLFVAGVFSDLLELRQRSLVLACICGLLGAYALWSLMEITRVTG